MSHISQKHWDTPHKADLQAQAKLLKIKNLRDINDKPITQRHLFSTLGVPATTGYRIIDNTDPRRLKHSEFRLETRGRKSQITERDIRAVERLL